MKKILIMVILPTIIFLSACTKSPIIEPILDQIWNSDTEVGASCSLNSTWNSSCDVNTWEIVSIKSTWEIALIKKNSKWFAITSTAFQNKWKIPAQYSCDWKNINPSFEIQNPPKWTQSFAMIVYDPDSPSWDWVHRAIRNFPLSVKKIDEWKIPLWATIGKNSQWKNAYSWPCPPNGTHRYFFKLYALDINFWDPQYKVTLKQFESTFSWHILWTTEIYWTYSK